MQTTSTTTSATASTSANILSLIKNVTLSVSLGLALGLAVGALLLATGCQDSPFEPPEPYEGCALVGTAWTGLAGDIYLDDPSDTTVAEDPAGNVVHIAVLGIDPDASELLIAFTFEGAVSALGITQTAADLDGMFIQQAFA